MAPKMPGKKRAAKRKANPRKSGGTVTIKGTRGKKPIKFQKGGLHRSLGVPQGTKIPAAKMQAALAGKYGPKAKKQAQLATGPLAAGRRTAKKS